MNYVVKGLVLVGVVFALFWTLQTDHHWTAIAILLAIIFYALFANPMAKFHVSEKEKAHSSFRSRIKKSKRKKKR